MGAYFNDPEYTARIDRDALANPSPGPTLGAWEQAGLGVMRGGAMAADAVRMAAAAPVVAFGDDETQDAYFAATDEVIKSAVDRWTPDPATTTLAGRVMGGLAEAALPLMAAGGNPALLMASNQTRTSRSLVDQGVDASTARDVGMVDALTIGAGFMIPAVGRTLASKLAFGAVSNPLLNAAGITVQAGALNEAGAPQAAAQYDPWDLESRAVDAALGAAFGGMAHAMGAPGGAPPMGPGFDDVGRVFRESVDEILTYRGAQRYESRALGAPTIAARNAHNAAMRAAMEAMIRDEPVNVGRADMPPPPDVPVLDGAAIGREIALDVFAPKPVPVVAAVPPAPKDEPAAALNLAAKVVKITDRESSIGTANDAYPAFEAKMAKAVEGGQAVTVTLKDGSAVRLVNGQSTGGDGVIFAFDDTGKQVGSLRYSLAEEADGTRWNPEVHVTEAARRKGIATAMYDLAEATGGKIPKESQAGQVRSGDGAAFRKARGTSTGETAFAGTAPPAAVDTGAGRPDANANANAGAERVSTAQAGEDIDLELLPQARDLVAAEPDAPIMMPDDLTETTAAQALADADAAIVEAETTYQRAAHAAAGCLLG